MSAENAKVCCNCRHCIRERDEGTLHTRCHCEVDGKFLSYTTVMEWWCRHWSKEKGRRMNIGRALAIFENIENVSVSTEEKGMAIRIVMNMETHNSVRKSSMLKVIRWLWDMVFEIKYEIKQDGEVEEGDTE